MIFYNHKIFLVFFLCLVAGIIHAQTTLYVSVDGNNQNPGSMAKPFRTIDFAMEQASRMKGRDVTIFLRKGTYYIDKTIVVSAGSFQAKSLNIMAFSDEDVVLSAGRRLHLKWKVFRNGIYVTGVPENVNFERLYVNGQPQILTRYPNYDSAARVFHGTSADAISADRVKQWKNPVGGYVHALHAHEWGGMHYRIVGKDDNGNLKLEGGWQNNRPSEMNKEFRFVENIFEELDAPGEWWLDREKHLLYYYPSKGVDLEDAVVEVSHLKNTIELKGSENHPLKNINITGIRFAHNERSFMDTREPLLRSDWAIYRGAAVLLEGTENCKISDCIFEGIGGNAIMLSQYNQYDTISGCHIYHIGANAISVIGDTKAVRSPSFAYQNYVRYEEMDKTPGPLNNNFPQQCLASDNLIHDIGEIEKQVAGVQIEVASEITISHNTIYNVPRAGINIGDGCFGGHVIEFNDVFNTVRETGDHGAFNSWGRDRYWSPDRNYMDSLVELHPELILLDAQEQTIIRNNRFRCDHGWDIDLDDGSSNYSIYNNVCLNGGLKLREGFYRVVKNNIIINNSFHPHVWFKNSGDVFERNIVMKRYAPIQVNDWGDSIDFNFFPDTSALNDAQSRGTDKHSLAGNPLFVNPVKGDYSVDKNSPALKIGFQNFPMNEFGVQKVSLRVIAEKPEIPVLITDPALGDKSALVAFFGGFVKSVDGMGDRSAYGLPDEKGVIVISAGENSLLARSGLMDKDVIHTVEDNPVADVRQLIDMVQSLNWKGQIPLEVIRNQQLILITLKVK